MLFVNVFLIKSEKNLIVPLNWVQNLEVVDLLNNGVHSGAVYNTFYSMDNKAVAAFNLPISNHFIPGTTALYECNIRRVFGK